jgi:hypothetical protein
MLTPDDFHTPLFRRLAADAKRHVDGLAADSLNQWAEDAYIATKHSRRQGIVEGLRLLLEDMKTIEKEMMGLNKDDHHQKGR